MNTRICGSHHASRHEYKLLLSRAQYMEMSARVSAVLDRDIHSADGGYNIRSVYFDDYAESAYYLKLYGICDRKKYRLRIYNFAEDLIILERKEKHNDSVSKYAAFIDRGECMSILGGDFSFLADRKEDVCQSMFLHSRLNGLHTSVILGYRREAFVYPASNLRITFDSGLHTWSANAKFDIFDKNIPSIMVYPFDNVILEIKYDDFLPGFITDLIPPFVGSPISISKYCECKRVFKAITVSAP